MSESSNTASSEATHSEAVHSEATDSETEIVGLNTPFRLFPGSSVSLGDAHMDAQVTVGLDAVSNDSRCPRDVQCMWEGDAEVAVWLRVGDDERRKAVLHVTRDPKTFEHGGYRLVLQGLEPYPVSTESIAAEDYVALLEIQR